ncbi:MAG: hypothetical protein DHS20C17_36050 [Cyclobacteriaceae bacterium]|nr:MAG: hypothetical protein DHS20C17_36050 [Cyclobacteriaceae bacterium]
MHYAGAGSALLTLPSALWVARKYDLPVRAITSGPGFHWFGYYDKLQFNQSNTKVLAMAVDFEMRSPTKDDVIKMGVIDLENNDRWTEIGESRAWGWQQGCMLQWVPGSESMVIWNDRRGENFVSILKDLETGEEQIIPRAIYTLSPDGKSAIGTDYARIQNYRKGYGYAGGIDPYKHQNAPKESGIYKIDLATGDSELIISYHEVSKIANNGEDLTEKWHYFNHLLISPDSQRFIFLNRYREAPIEDSVLNNPEAYNKIRGKYTTRLFTVGMNGEDIYLLDPSGKTSHFIWKDPEHITAWTRPVGMPDGFYEFRDQTKELRQVGAGVMKVNGHNTFLPGTHTEWILNDTYPQGEAREQIPYLFHEKTNKRIDLGRFHEPKEYNGEWRCDTHPRASNDGKLVCIDSTHGGNGRQLYLIDISSLSL